MSPRVHTTAADPSGRYQLALAVMLMGRVLRKPRVLSLRHGEESVVFTGNMALMLKTSVRLNVFIY